MHRWNGFTAARFVGLDNYARITRDTQWWQSVLTTVQFGAGRLMIEISVALALAYVFFRGVRAGTVYRTLIVLPHVLSMAIVGIIFGFLLRDVGGPFNQILTGLGLAEPVAFLGDAGNALRSLIGVGVWAHVGINMLLFFAGMTTVPTEILEAQSSKVRVTGRRCGTSCCRCCSR